MNVHEVLRPYQETVNEQAERIRLLQSRINDAKVDLDALADWLSPDVKALQPVEFSAAALTSMRTILRNVVRRLSE